MPQPGLVDPYRAAAHAPNTTRAYDADWRHFAAWCERQAVEPLPAPPRAVARYLTALVDGARAPDGTWVERPRSLATLARRLATIRQYHRAAGHAFDGRDPVLRDTWRGIQRAHAAPPRNKVPTVTEILRSWLRALPDTTAGIRDRALLLIGFAGAFRRSELVAIDVADCAWHTDGLIIMVPASPSTPNGPSVEIGLPYGAHAETCPIRALAHWLAIADIGEGPLFRPVTRHGSILPQRLSDRAVALVIKRTVEAARDTARAQGNAVLADSLDPARFAGHSLRAGFIVSAAAAGVSERDIMRHTRHKRADTLLKYVQHAALFRRNAAAQVGL